MGETGHRHVEGHLVGGVGPVLPAGVEEDVLHMTWGVRPHCRGPMTAVYTSSFYRSRQRRPGLLQTT